MDAGRPPAQDYPAPLINSTTGQCTNTGKHSFSLWLSFSAIIQQGRAVEHAFGARVRIATPTGNIPETSKVRTPLYSGHFRWHQWCLHYRGSTADCIAVFKALTFWGAYMLCRHIMHYWSTCDPRLEVQSENFYETLSQKCVCADYSLPQPNFKVYTKQPVSFNNILYHANKVRFTLAWAWP